MRKPLIAIKSIKYAGRRIQPGEPFEAKRREARILVGSGKARYQEPDAPEPTERATAPAKPATLARTGENPPAARSEPAEPGPPAPSDPADLSKLTNAELRVIANREGVALEGRETKAQLVDKITANRRGGAYGRRDMRAEG